MQSEAHAHSGGLELAESGSASTTPGVVPQLVECIAQEQVEYPSCPPLSFRFWHVVEVLRESFVATRTAWSLKVLRCGDAEEVSTTEGLDRSKIVAGARPRNTRWMIHQRQVH